MIGKPVEFADASRLRDTFLKADKRSWCCFAPFLCAFSLVPNRVVCVGEISESLCITVRRPERVDLLMPPVPFDQGVLDQVVDLCAEKHGGQRPRILWVDAVDAARLNKNQFELRKNDAEYLYDPSRVFAYQGRAFRDVRKRVRRFERAHSPIFRLLKPEDISDCKALLKHWRRRQGRRHPFLLDWGYTVAALDQFHGWPEAMLEGWCVEIDGQIDAFALAGEMQADLAHFFVAKSDPDLPDLSYFLRWRVYGELSHYRLVNDASDLGLPGLRQFKQKFRPVDMWEVFTAEPRGDG